MDGEIIIDTRANLDKFATDLEKIGKVASGSLSELDKSIKSIVDGIKSISFKPIGEDISKITQGLDPTNITKTKDEVTKLNNEAKSSKRQFSALTSTFRRFGSSLKHIGTLLSHSVGKGFKSLAGHLRIISSESKSTTNNLRNFGKRMRSILWTVGVFAVIRRGLTLLRQELGRTLRANEEFAASWNAIRVNLATAFNPIWEALLPALNALMAALAAATQALATFLALIFGTTYVQARANAAALRDQASAMNDVGGAAKAARKELFDFDTIQKLTEQSAGGAGSAIEGMDFSAVEPPSQELIDWLEEFKNRLASLEPEIEFFHDLGYRMGEAIAEQLRRIDWRKIQRRASILGAELAALLNGALVTSTLVPQLGMTLGEAIQTAIEFAYGFLIRAGGFDFLGFGKRIGQGLNEAVAAINWRMAGQVFGAYIQGLIDMGLGVVTRINWLLWGRSIANFINGAFARMDLGRAGRALNTAILGVLDMINVAIRRTDWQGIGRQIGDFFAEIEWRRIFQEAGQVIKLAVNAMFTVLTEAFGGWGYLLGGVFIAKLILALSGAKAKAAVKVAISKNLLAPVLTYIKGTALVKGFVALKAAIATKIGVLFAGVAGIVGIKFVALAAALTVLIVSLVRIFDEWFPSAERTENTLRRMQERTDEVTSSMKENLHMLELNGRGQSDLADEYRNRIAAIEEQTRVIMEAQEGTALSKRNLRDLETAHRNYIRAIQDGIEIQRDIEKHERRYADIQLDKLRATENLEKAQKNYNRVLEKYGKDSPQYIRATWELERETNRLADAQDRVNDYYVEIARLEAERVANLPTELAREAQIQLALSHTERDLGKVQEAIKTLNEIGTEESKKLADELSRNAMHSGVAWDKATGKMVDDTTVRFTGIRKVTARLLNYRHFRDIGKLCKDGLDDGMEGISENAQKRAEQMVRAMENEFEVRSPSRKFTRIGKLCLDGLDLGMSDAPNRARTWASGIISAMTRRFAVQSPSQVMIEIGEYLCDGLAIGMENNAYKVIDVAQKIADDINDTFDFDPDVDYMEKILEAIQEGNIELARELEVMRNKKIEALQMDYEVTDWFYWFVDELEDVFDDINDILDYEETVFEDAGKMFIECMVDGIESNSDKLINSTKELLNTITSLIETMLNNITIQFNNTLSQMAASLSDLTGSRVSFRAVPMANIPRLAEGGIISSPGLFMAGEAGAEVIPIQNNMDWADNVAARMIENFSINPMIMSAIAESGRAQGGNRGASNDQTASNYYIAEKLDELIELISNTATEIPLNVDGKELARIGVPLWNQEESRVGMRISNRRVSA